MRLVCQQSGGLNDDLGRLTHELWMPDLFSSIALGAVTVFWFRLHDPKHIRLLNAFTGDYLRCLALLHLLPEPYHDPHGDGPKFHLLIGALSMGVEHGHSHALHGACPSGSSSASACTRLWRPWRWGMRLTITIPPPFACCW
jgi:hypothetical protein